MQVFWVGIPVLKPQLRPLAGRSTRALLMNEGKDDEVSWWIPSSGGWKSVGGNGLKDMKYTYLCPPKKR